MAPHLWSLWSKTSGRCEHAGLQAQRRSTSSTAQMEAGYGRMCCQGNPLGRKHESGHWCHGTYGTPLSSRNRWSMEKVAITISSRSPILEGVVRVVGVVTCHHLIIWEANAHPRTLQHVSTASLILVVCLQACWTRVPLNSLLLQSVVRRCILQLQKQMSTQFLPRFQRDVHASHRESLRRFWQLLEGGEESVMCGMISSLSTEYSIYFNLL